GVDSLEIDDEQHKISGLAAKLKANVPAFQDDHGGRSPWAGESLAATACHCATTVVSPHTDGEFLYRGNHDHAFRLVQNRLGNVVRNVENLHENFSGVAKTVLFVLLGLDHGGTHKRCNRESKEFFHAFPLVGSVESRRQI